jgi:hypothetical protein
MDFCNDQFVSAIPTQHYVTDVEESVVAARQCIPNFVLRRIAFQTNRLEESLRQS